jgi:hypothetical protein
MKTLSIFTAVLFVSGTAFAGKPATTPTAPADAAHTAPATTTDAVHADAAHADAGKVKKVPGVKKAKAAPKTEEVKKEEPKM